MLEFLFWSPLLLPIDQRVKKITECQKIYLTYPKPAADTRKGLLGKYRNKRNSPFVIPIKSKIGQEGKIIISITSPSCPYIQFQERGNKFNHSFRLLQP